MKDTILVGVCAGIAAYKVAELVDALRLDGENVSVVMTAHATQMIDPRVFEKASGNDVYTVLFEKDFDYRSVLEKRVVEHIALADTAKLFVIAPATANIIAKLAHGIADDMVTTTALAVTCPVLVCPSMNVHMWQHPAVQHNIKLLKSRGIHILEPDEGDLACGYKGKGRLVEIPILIQEIETILKRSTVLRGKRILVTSGGTQEPIDAVRSIGNRSSGKMGAAIADACVELGAEVCILRAKGSHQSRYSIEEHSFETADELAKLISFHAPRCDGFYHVAAVSDFSVQDIQKGKISSKKTVTLRLAPRPKILDTIKTTNPNIVLIAFKAEYGLTDKHVESVVRKRLHESQADGIVFNDISKPDRGFQVDTNACTVFWANGTTVEISLNSKQQVARELVDLVTKKFF